MTRFSTAVPDDRTAALVAALGATVESEDGAPPLSDQALSRMRSDAVRHTVAIDDARIVGYVQRDAESAEIVAVRDAVDAMVDAVAEPGLLAWTHGRRSRLVEPFEARGFERARELHQLRRPLDRLDDDPPLPDGIVVRAFRPGADDAAWLALNAAAFVHHPEQGRMTQADLDARKVEAWFDAAGFLVAERGDDLVAFHWTKVHPDGLGEVYVLGVSPDAQGLGLGGALLVRGLRHLRAVGCSDALLYVDGDNPRALHLYERDGFRRFELDVQWRMQ